MQVFVALCVVAAITSPSTVWNALAIIGGSPALALTFVVLIAAPNQGTNTLFAMFLVVASVIGGLLGIAVSYVAWAANGNSYEETVIKGVVFTLFFSVIAGILNAVRWKNDVTNIFFLLIVAVMVFSGGVSTYRLNYVEWKAPLYGLIYCSMAASAVFLSSWFVLPVTAGSQYRRMMSRGLSSTASALGSIETTMLAPLNPRTGLLADATGHLDPSNASDMGLAENVAGVNGHLRAARGALMASLNMHVPVMLEIDIYNSPKIFPRAEFTHTKLCSWVVLNSMPIIARSLNTGHLKLSLLQKSPLKERFQAVMGGMQNVLNALAAIVVTQKDFQRADDELALLDAAWMALLDDCKAALESCNDEDENFAVLNLSALLHIAGSSVRTVYVAVPPLVISGDPEAPNIAEHRMQECPGWIRPSQAFHHPHFKSNAALEKMQKATQLHEERELYQGQAFPSVSGDTDAGKKENNKASWLTKTKAVSRKFTTRKIDTTPGIVRFTQKWTGSSQRAVRHLWHLPAWAVFGIQYGVAIAIAVGMSSVPIIAEKGFSGRPSVVVITVAVTWRPSIAGVHMRALNRLLGTVLAVIWSYFLLGVAYLANGLSWDDTAGKWIAASIMVAIWGGFCAANSLRTPTLSYMWLVAGFSVPLVTISSMRNNLSPLDDVIFRFFNVAIGVCIVWVVSATFLPISARRIVKANYLSILENLKTYIRLLPAHLAPEVTLEQDPTTARHHFAFSRTKALYGAIFSPENQKSISLSIRIQRGLTYLLSLVPFLAADYHPCINPHRVSADNVLSAAESVQSLKDIMAMGFTMGRMSNERKEWHIPPVHYRFFSVVLGRTADAIDTLQQVLRREVSMESALRTIKLLDSCVDELTQETLKAVVEADGEPASINNGAHVPATIALPMGLLLYLSITASEQVKLLYSATARSFLVGDAEAVELANAVAAQITNTESKNKAKDLIALVMERNYVHIPQILIHTAALSDDEASNGAAGLQ